MRLLTVYLGDGDGELLDRLRNYSKEYHYQALSKSVRELLHLGLKDWETRNRIKAYEANNETTK